jgi:hypothetical protein
MFLRTMLGVHAARLCGRVAGTFLAAHEIGIIRIVGGLGQWTGHGRGQPIGGVSVRPFVRPRCFPEDRASWAYAFLIRALFG